MMSANCSVVVTLSRVGRPCRAQCCSAKCLISTCLDRPGPKRVAMPMHADASSFKQAVMVYPSSRKATRAHTHKQLSSKIHFHHCSTLLVSAFETNQPRTLLQASTNPQWSTSVFRRGLPTIHHSSQPFPSTVPRGRTNSRCMSRGPLNVAQNSFQTSHVTLGRRGTSHCQRLCRVMQVETVSLEAHQDAHN